MKKNNNKAFLAFSFSPGFSSPQIPIATFRQGDVELNFIIDTGSDQNVIDSTALALVEHEMTENKSTLMGLSGSQNVGSCIITFQNEGEDYSAEFLVSDTLKEAFDGIRKAHAIPIHGMLGSRFLKQNNIVLDFNNLVAYNKNE